MHYIYLFLYVESSLHPWNEPNLIMVYDHFNELYIFFFIVWMF
jgi:hypothetical protein